MSDTDVLLIRNKRAQINALEKRLAAFRLTLEEALHDLSMGEPTKRMIRKALKQ